MQRIVRRSLAWLLLILGIGALGAQGGDLQRMDSWAWLSVLSLAGAPALGLRAGSPLQFLLTSIPFWIFGNALDWLTIVAVALTIASLAAVAVMPTLVGRRVNRPARMPLAHLTSGPLVPVAPEVFPCGRRSRLLIALAWIFAGLAGVLATLIGLRAVATELAGLVVAAVIVSATFAFANWFADRVRVRVDEVGVHGRTLLVEHTTRWSDITGLRLRYVFLPGYGIRLVYYVVESARHEVAFPSSIAGAGTLRACIESATGLQWPEPEITATM